MSDNFIISQSSSDNKVKWNSTDPTAGYLIDKVDTGVFNNFDVVGLSAQDAGIDILGVASLSAQNINTLELSANSGIITNYQPYSYKQTWNNASTLFDAFTIDVEGTTNSFSTSTLFSVNADNKSKFKINKGDANTSSFTMGSSGGDFIVNVGGNLASFSGNHNIAINNFTVARANATIGGVITSLQTWSASATTFTGFKMNVTDTASSGSSLLMDLQVGSVSKCSIAKGGNIVSAGSIFAGGYLASYAGGQPGLYLFSNTGYISFGSNQNTFLRRDADHVLAQYNSTNPQEYRIYGTYTSATNYERLSLVSSATEFTIRTEKGSAGGTARPLVFGTDGTSRWNIDITGNIMPSTHNTYDIGANSTRIRQVWVQGYIKSPTLYCNTQLSDTGTGTVSTLDGIIQLRNNNNDGFDRLQFGGTTASFPSLKRSTTELHARLADDSGYAVLKGDLVMTPLSAKTPANNGELTFEATSNTQLTIKYKGSDGVVRSVALTLA